MLFSLPNRTLLYLLLTNPHLIRMNLEEYLELTNFRIGNFAERIGTDPSVIYRWRKRMMRPTFETALQIVAFSNQLIKLEDLGYNPDGTKLIPWTQKELRNNLNGDGEKIHTTVYAHPMDPSKTKGEHLLQPQRQGEET